jgi:nucleoside-diphosphate-sugar epimerase
MRLILVTGATGKQGGAFISAICSSNGSSASDSAFRILALTRDRNSASAKRLALDNDVKVVEGNLDDALSVRRVFEDAKEHGGIWGVFCVLAFPGLGVDAEGEERQGKVYFLT